MCRAYFSDATGQPVIRASVVLPEIETGFETDFIVDTGADNTCVTELNSLTGAIHPYLLPPKIDVYESESTGVGGTATSYILDTEVLLAFEEYEEARERYSLHIEHLPGLRISTGSPFNLLGRDVIHRFTMDYNPVEGYIDMVRDNYGGGRYQCIAADEELSSGLRNFSD